ncbi:hypothetical protein EVJ30_13925 [Exiguobacterium sp. SH5S13]|uniref:hypothetical protein n=1 Tax=unclassified Exiguobacterium TaxID=2644629 RepID=UPI001040286A|nr:MULTISPECIES: hypothetical protein [unclassified Exiguobacterium]TCI24833.1 hypothetical protein EVJ32_12720 [Exiguobacterium sp. SH5S4]TCI49934.1 hypothetical protein EVJ30_13925 [Exiguobacterium sp. SH5S13]
MSYPWQEKYLVNEYVDTIARSPIIRFYPTAVAKYAKTSPSRTFKYLIEMAEEGRLNLLWELRCPNYECLRTIQISKNASDFPVEFTCRTCGEFYEVDESMYFPAFEVNSEYKKFIRESSATSTKKKTLSLSLS